MDVVRKEIRVLFVILEVKKRLFVNIGKNFVFLLIFYKYVKKNEKKIQ